MHPTDTINKSINYMFWGGGERLENSMHYMKTFLEFKKVNKDLKICIKTQRIATRI